jgi:hypothetical protein
LIFSNAKSSAWSVLSHPGRASGPGVGVECAAIG